jgi:uncharacterized tellurite resistance protein B-like protein
MFESLLTTLRGLIENIAPRPETLARRDALALQRACCVLLMEVVRLDTANAEQKRQVVAQVMREQFGISDQDSAPMIESAGRPENRLTSCFKPVVLINKRFGLARKAQFIEQLWRVAMVDGKIDMYEDQLVRNLANLLYVPHTDFILAKNRVQASAEAQAY